MLAQKHCRINRRIEQLEIGGGVIPFSPVVNIKWSDGILIRISTLEKHRASYHPLQDISTNILHVPGGLFSEYTGEPNASRLVSIAEDQMKSWGWEIKKDYELGWPVRYNHKYCELMHFDI